MVRSTLAVLIAMFLFPASAATVPFVGCPSDGQVGPDPAPRGKPVAIALDPKIAVHLAFYQSKYDEGVLAPRGWHCVNLEGSSGWFTIVAREPVKAEDFIRRREKPITGPAIQISMNDGGTSGRFEVARLVARYFPQRRAFLQNVLAEGIEPASDFPNGGFKTDRIVQRQDDLIEVLTPPYKKGLGTMSRLVPSDLPIHAAAVVTGSVDDDWGGIIFSVRLASEQDALAPTVLAWNLRHYRGAK